MFIVLNLSKSLQILEYFLQIKIGCLWLNILNTNSHLLTSMLCLTDVWVFACLYPINLKTAEQIGPKYFVGPHMSPVKVYGCLAFQNLSQNKLIFVNF